MTFTKNHQKRIASLSRKKGRSEHGQMLIEGMRAVESAIEGNAPLIEILVAADLSEEPEVQRLLKRAGVPIHQISERDSQKLSTVINDQGILAVAKCTQYVLTDLLGEYRILILDGIQDPGNVGTMIRSAAWFGIRGILAGPGTADFFNPKVVRATMGGLWDVRVAQTNDLPDSISILKTHGWQLAGADLEGKPIDDWNPASSCALVIGNEANGISDEVKSVLDQKIKIPGASSRRAAESLNAAVAAGILMHRWMNF